MTEPFDAVDLETIRNQLEGIATEMGRTLIRGAYAPNIKERRDGSTALFDRNGRLVAQAEHIPVHLGAMPDSVAAVIETQESVGATYLLNDPYLGGSHLPDVTVVAPLFAAGEHIGYGAVRAHWADIGSATPGSLPAGSRDIYAEGLRIPPIPIAEDGDRDEVIIDMLLANVREPAQRRADLRAQLGAIEVANRRIESLAEDHGRERLLTAFDALRRYSRRRTERAIDDLPDGTHTATDHLEGDGITDDPIPITATVTIDGTAIDIDFTGTAPQVAGNLNAPPSVAKSAVYYVIRCVTDPDIPANHGCYEPISISIPSESLLDPTPPAAVAGGNVETSQRIVDVLQAALREPIPSLPAHGQGTMNNVLIGTRTSEGWTYYETIGGGAGARPNADGTNGIHVGMTNTRNTPIEALEREYPLLVESYQLRPDSGGTGRFQGGDGIERAIRVEEPAVVTILSDRRARGPPGVAGGGDGATGENLLDGEVIAAKTTVTVDAEAVVSILTPGGGGYGRSTASAQTDREPGQDDTRTTDR